MALNKIGSPEKIKLIKLESALAFDPNILVTKLLETWKQPTITIDQLHEAIKASGITDYTSEDMNEVINLLKSSGIEVKNT